MKQLIRILCVLIAMTMLFSAALADQTTSLITSGSMTVTLTLKSGDTCDQPTQESGSIVRLTARRPGCADVIVSVATADLDEALSLADLSPDDLAALKSDILSDYPDGIITEHKTASGSLYLLVDANGDYDLHNMFTLYKGFYIDLVQYKADFSDLTRADDDFLLDVMQGIWAK